MENREAYNQWSGSYDTVINKTRDLEAKALQSALAPIQFLNVIELGCGTGKNTRFLSERASKLIAVDFSPEMMAKGKEKINADHVDFKTADITKAWNFIDYKVDLISCSLVLEHIKDLHFIFQQAAATVKPGGHFYIGELHPFKQYQGSKAKFEQATGTFELECFIHNISDYMEAAAQNDFVCASLTEWFDDNDKTAIPRIIAFVFDKK